MQLRNVWYDLAAIRHSFNGNSMHSTKPKIPHTRQTTGFREIYGGTWQRIYGMGDLSGYWTLWALDCMVPHEDHHANGLTAVNVDGDATGAGCHCKLAVLTN